MKTLKEIRNSYQELGRDQQKTIQGGNQTSVVIWCRMAITDECNPDHSDC
ncbi:hypothetical protein [Aquimarina litoralis]|nr:hypothetical protein [Aquimarina litoralis]